MQQFNRLTVTNIENPMGCRGRGRIWVKRIKLRISSRRFITTTNDTLNNIFDIGEITLHLAMVKHLDRLTRQNRPGKQHRSHIRSPPRAIHREKTQPGSWQPIEMAIGMSHQLIRLLAGGLETHRMVERLTFMDRQIAIAAVHRTA